MLQPRFFQGFGAVFAAAARGALAAGEDVLEHVGHGIDQGDLVGPEGPMAQEAEPRRQPQRQDGQQPGVGAPACDGAAAQSSPPMKR